MNRSCISWAHALATVIFIFTSAHFLPAGARAAEPFGPLDFDAQYSDATSVRYEVSRSCLADQTTCLGVPGLTSLCRTTDSITGLRCNVGIHRFCGAKGHVSGYGVEDATDSSLVDITCVTSVAAETKVPTHAELEAEHGACTDALPSLHCSVAIDRYCRNQAGFVQGFGPLERNSSIAVVACLRADAAQSFNDPASQVEAVVSGCQLSSGSVSTECRQAMDLHCQNQDPDLRGGYGPRELGTNVNLGCVEKALPWQANTTRPESPALPVDVLGRPIDPSTGGLDDLRHSSLSASRSLSFDGRLRVSFWKDGTVVKGLKFVLHTPEIFAEPLSQQQPAGKDRSYEQGFWGEFYAFNVEDGPTTQSTNADAIFPFTNTTGGALESASSAFCDPHQGSGSLTQTNRQQSVPDRVSNPYACNSSGATTGTLDHDCYDLTVVTVYDTGTQDELWGTPVRIVVTNPKGSGTNGQNSSSTRAHVVDVQSLGSPVKASFPTGQPRHILEPNITGDGRLIVIQGDGMIRYSVIPESENPCDVAEWDNFKHLYEMHTDPDVADYGIAKYPVRDFEGNVLSPSISRDQRVRAGYPWIDRDGDNMMFMLGTATLFYMDEQEQAQEKFPVVSHPYSGTDPDIPCSYGCTTVPLHPSTRVEVEASSDHLPRVGLTFVGLWTQGKMFQPDNRNNSADLAVPGGTQFHRNLLLYSDVPAGNELGTTIRTSINSAENQLFFHPNLRPDTPREVVWFLSTQDQTDEVAFDDAMDPRALIVSPMNVTIDAYGAGRGVFQDGFVKTGLYDGEGFQFPAHISNASASVSEEVVTYADVDLSANVQWNTPAYGYLLGGARAEPIAAGGFKSRGLWLDGVDDRLEYLVPPPPSSRQTEMDDGTWLVNVSIDPRDLTGQTRLLTLPDGTWLDVVDEDTLRFGRTTTFDVSLPSALALAERTWSTIGIVSKPAGSGFDVDVYLDGFLLESFSPSGDYFRIVPGRLTVGAESGGFEGWVDDFKVIGRDPGPEVICNHARGTLIGTESGDDLYARAGAYPSTSHQAITALVPQSQTFPRYACERPIANPSSIADLADHDNYTCLGQTRRLEGHPDADKCLKHAILFPEGPLFVDEVRPTSTANAFCTSCHVNSHPSETMTNSDALSSGLALMPDDIRRQPMQNSPKFCANVPAGIFNGEPMTTFQTPVECVDLDPYTTPESP